MKIPSINDIPALGLGTYPLQGAECEAAVRTALDLGYRHIDTAQMYGNERAVGNALKACGLARNELFVTTKVDPSNLGKARFSDSVRKSMDDLGGPTDLLLIHWPPDDAAVDATLDLLRMEQQRGMCQRIGVSNFSPRLLRQAVARLGASVICNQVEFHLLLDQGKLKSAADALGVALVAYSPLARGAALKPKAVQDIAARHGRPASEIVLRWIVQQGVVAIPMTTKRENAASNLRIFEFELSAQEMTLLSSLGSAAGRTIAPGWMKGRFDD